LRISHFSDEAKEATMQSEVEREPPQPSPAEPLALVDIGELLEPIPLIIEPAELIPGSFFDHLAEVWAQDPERWDGLE
jgi:hypothetical protein